MGEIYLQENGTWLPALTQTNVEEQRWGIQCLVRLLCWIDQGPETVDNEKIPGSETGKKHKLRADSDSGASSGQITIPYRVHEKIKY